MKIEVHESALDAIKAMRQRDKERIAELENALHSLTANLSAYWENDSGKNWDFLNYAHDKAISVLRVNHYSTAIIQKAE